MFYSVEPALAPRLADKIRAARQQPRHRMIEAAHQRAVDEQVVGDHGYLVSSFRDGALAPDLRCAIAHRGISRFRVRCFASPRNDERTPPRRYAAATTSSLMTRNFTKSMRPKLVVSATSAASRPVAIRMRPIRGGWDRRRKGSHGPAN